MLGYLLLCCHLVGDYLLQSQAMADRKVTDFRWAVIHAMFYLLPFMVVPFVAGVDSVRWVVAVNIIFWSHAIIDRFRVAARLAAWYGTGTRKSGIWAKYNVSQDDVPPFLSVWLTIIADNTLHLVINGVCVAWALMDKQA